MGCTVRTAATAVLLMASPALGQSSRIALGASVATFSVRDAPAYTGTLRGPVFGVDVAAAVALFTLRARYRQGALADAGLAGTRRLVEGELMGGIALGRWAEVLAGPRVRAHVLPEGLHRGVYWDARILVAPLLIGDVVGSRVQAWHSVSGTVNAGDGHARGWGGEAALDLRPAVLPVWLRLGYRVDGSRFGDGRRETSEEFFATVVAAVVR